MQESTTSTYYRYDLGRIDQPRAFEKGKGVGAYWSVDYLLVFGNHGNGPHGPGHRRLCKWLIKSVRKPHSTYYHYDLSRIDRPAGVFEMGKVGHDGENGHLNPIDR